MKLRIKEAFDSSLPKWVIDYLTPGAGKHNFSAAIDLANAVYTDVTNSTSGAQLAAAQRNGRPDWGDFIIRGVDDAGLPFIFIPGTYTGSKVQYKNQYRDLDNASGSWLLDHAKEIGRLEFDKQGLKDIRLQRHQDKEGSNWDRDRLKQRKDRWGDWTTGPDHYFSDTFDKSGYKIAGLQKYQRMLGELDLQNFSKVLDDAYELYVQLQTYVPLVRGDRYKKPAFIKLTSRYVDIFDTLQDYYDRYSDDPDSYYTSTLEDKLYSLRRFNKGVQEFIDHLVHNDADSEYYKRISG